MECRAPRLTGAGRTPGREVAPLRASRREGTIVGMTPTFLSDRDRLLLAFANLASYGIAARDAYGDSATEAHAAVAADLRLRRPHGLGAYVFWTRTDDASRFDAYGNLTSELPLHTGGDRTAEAVRSAAALVGIELAVADDGLRVLAEGQTLARG
jgi:hypothetical protein